MRRLTIFALPAVVLLATIGIVRPWAEDLLARAERLRRETRYDEALRLLEEEEAQRRSLTPGMKWVRACLVPDADRFDRLAAELTSGKSAADSMVQGIVLARGREQFARGQYLSALEGLRSLPASARARYPEVATFEAMASLAVGEMRRARQILGGVPESSPEYAMAQTLLADLTLRAGESDTALEHAERALQADAATIGAQALYVQVQALSRSGREDEATRVRTRLARDFPQSVEAAWLQEPGEAVAQPGEESSEIPEIEAPLVRQGFALQFGAFHDRRLALHLAGGLSGSVEDLRLERDLTVSPGWYRVIGGSFTTRTAADAALAALQQRGIEAVVLRPGRGG